MDVALTELDGTLLAAHWVRAVLSQQTAIVAAIESEAALRGTTPQALIAAPKGKAPARTGKYDKVVAQSQKNIAEGKSYDTGQKKYGSADKGKGKGKFRKKSGAGGGQFTSADDPQAVAEGEITAGRNEQKGLAAERKQRTADRRAEDEQERRAKFEKDTASHAADADERAKAVEARNADKELANQVKEAKAARKAVEDASDADLATRIRANSDYETAKRGEITLARKLLDEARQLGKDDDERKLTKQIQDATDEIAKTQQEGRTLQAERQNTTATRTQRAREEAAAEAADRTARSSNESAARANAAEAKRRQAEQDRIEAEAARRAKSESRAAEDADYEARAQALRDRIDAARARAKEAAAAKKKPKK